MNKEGLAVFRESLNCLRYSGTTVKAFAEKINMSPQSLYNYRNGQMPSPQGFRYIMFMLQKKCPEALQKGIEIYKASQEEDSILNNLFDDKGIDNNEKNEAATAVKGGEKMQTWIGGKCYEVENYAQMTNIMVKNHMEYEKERKRKEEIESLRKENKQIKQELEHMKYQLTLIIKQQSISTNNNYGISQKEMGKIVDAGSELVAQDAWEIFKNIKPPKGSKNKWTIK